MTTTSLTDRYVAAAMRTVPEKQRDDVGAELRASIDDQIDARVEIGEPHSDAERAVLTELGDPDKLAAGYTDRTLYLIGPRYYLDWWRLLKLLWAIVPACAVFGVALGMTIAGESFGEIVRTIWVVLLSVVVHIAFWTTLVFFVVERSSGGAALTQWSVDQLPEPTPRGVGFSDMIASLVLLAVGAGAIVWDRTIGFAPGFTTADGEPLSFLDPDLWPWWITGLFVVMALEAALAIVVYLMGRWTVWTAVVNAVLALAVAVPALLLLAQGQLINPAFFTTVIPDDGAQVSGILNVIAGFLIAGIALWDIIDVTIKTVRARR